MTDRRSVDFGDRFDSDAAPKLLLPCSSASPLPGVPTTERGFSVESMRRGEAFRGASEGLTMSGGKTFGVSGREGDAGCMLSVVRSDSPSVKVVSNLVSRCIVGEMSFMLSWILGGR